ncbi:MAG: nucleoside transporter C-terminal domain-containing protein, partial [Planctomycetota bacterium]
WICFLREWFLMESYNLVSFGGIFILLAVAWIFSRNRKNLNFRLILWGLALQMAFAGFIFIVPAGAKAFLLVNDAVVRVLEAASSGISFVFGKLAIPAGKEGSLGFILAFQALPAVIVFSALVSMLYYLGVMQLLIRLFARLFTSLMRISGAESLCAASNIFVGVESAIAVRPHLAKMTSSELCTILTVGMATVASNVLALYVFTLQDIFPTIAGHLISASFLSAPAALIMSKVLYPEDGEPVTLGKKIDPFYEKDNNLFESIINGANAGVKVAIGIAALLMAVLGLVALADLLIGGVGSWINDLCGLTVDWSIKGILGYLFYPVAVVIGIPLPDAGEAGRIIGERLVLTEVASYQHLAESIRQGVLTEPRSAVIIAYALCGFAHVASVAIFVGGVAALAPERTRDLTRVSMRALAAATFACLLTACVAGTFYSHEIILFGK